MEPSIGDGAKCGVESRPYGEDDPRDECCPAGDRAHPAGDRAEPRDVFFSLDARFFTAELLVNESGELRKQLVGCELRAAIFSAKLVSDKVVGGELRSLGEYARRGNSLAKASGAVPGLKLALVQCVAGELCDLVRVFCIGRVAGWMVSSSQTWISLPSSSESIG